MTKGENHSAWVISLTLGLVLVILGAGLYINTQLTLHFINSSQHQWCDTLNLITRQKVAKPADPKANPSRKQAYVFYQNMMTLKRNFGCG